MTEQRKWPDSWEWADKEIPATKAELDVMTAKIEDRIRRIEAARTLKSSERGLTDEQVKHMANRFLGWKLPENFHPDDGISFEPEFNKEWNAAQGKPPQRRTPTGTNLFNYTQAVEMVKHMIEGLPDAEPPSNARITPEWCQKMAELEAGQEIGAGVMAIDPFTPSAARGPTNDEPDFDQIFEEVQRRYEREKNKPPMQHCIEATRDTSWFKPEPELLEVTQADRDLWKYLLDAPKSKCSMMDTCDPATAELQAIARYRIEAFAKRDNELTEGKADQSWFKPEPEVDEATLVTRKMFARMEEVKGYTARSSDYHFGHADKENHFQTAREVIAEALAVPPDVEDAARWIFDKSGDWPDLAKANAQKLAEYALRGKR